MTLQMTCSADHEIESINLEQLCKKNHNIPSHCTSVTNKIFILVTFSTSTSCSIAKDVLHVCLINILHIFFRDLTRSIRLMYQMYHLVVLYLQFVNNKCGFLLYVIYLSMLHHKRCHGNGLYAYYKFLNVNYK